MDKATERKINRIYNFVYNKLFNKTHVRKLSRGIRTDILRAEAMLESSESFNKFAIEFSKELAKSGLRRQRGIWRKYYNVAKKRHYVALPKTWSEYEMKQLSEAVKHNFTMIKSIPKRTLEILEHKYTSTLIEEVAKGKLSRGSFERQLKAHGHKQAKLIARTETAKLQTAIVQNRSQDLGSVMYRWRSSHDKRTRPSHREMNDVIVFWRPQPDKPFLDNMYGNAGEFPNCRCSPQPILDENDITESWYKVYDYRQHKVITLGKKELIKAMNYGSLDNTKRR